MPDWREAPLQGPCHEQREERDQQQKGQQRAQREIARQRIPAGDRLADLHHAVFGDMCIDAPRVSGRLQALKAFIESLREILR